MESLYVLVPLSVVLVLAILALFAWALFTGQFDDIEREGQRILEDEAGGDPPTPAHLPPPLDAGQAGAARAAADSVALRAPHAEVARVHDTNDNIRDDEVYR